MFHSKTSLAYSCDFVHLLNHGMSMNVDVLKVKFQESIETTVNGNLDSLTCLTPFVCLLVPGPQQPSISVQ